VVLIALPFGAASARRNVFVGVAASIFIVFAYFILRELSLTLGTGGYVEPWLAAWAPNVFFVVAGILFTFKVR
jgi:lipopolysaccharide export system permease protein